LAKQSNQNSIILLIFAISRVQRHRQIGDTTVVMDWSTRKKEIGGALAPKQLNTHGAMALIIKTAKTKWQRPSLNQQWPLSATKLW
jgi:hypothetical protein